jgi:hypothetical protein
MSNRPSALPVLLGEVWMKFFGSTCPTSYVPEGRFVKRYVPFSPWW